MFAHPSEREIAGLFDSYGIRGEYEPTTFVLKTDQSGRPTVPFTPHSSLCHFAP